MVHRNNGSEIAGQPSVRLGALLLMAILLSACQINPYFWDRSVGKSIEKDIDHAAATAAKQALPPDISQALLPPLTMQLPDGSVAPLEARFDLSVNSASARQVFMGLVEGTGYSMLVHPDVGGAVSLHLKDVTVPEAMEAIRLVYGYEYKREGDRYFVLGRGMQTRIFPVNYLSLSRKGKSDTRITSGELTQTTGGGAGGGTTSSRSASIQVQTESQADFWKELKEVLTSLIGASGGRHVLVNPQSGLVVVRAMPDELRVVQDYLGITHDSVNRQVILEAKILNVQLKDGFQTGINWSALKGSSVFGQVGGGTIFNGTGLSEIAGNAGNVAGVLPSGTNTSAFGGVFTAAVASTDFGAFLELLKSQGNVHVLSSPRVSTVNNQKAVIKVGGDEFFITGVTSTPTATTVAGTPVFSTEVELTPFFSGIALDVTPQIDQDSNIILHIHPAVSEVKQKNNSFTVNNQNSSLPLAVSSIQESDNVVRAQSGQIIVIGGLMKETSNDEESGIPLLADLPLIGNVFKHKRVVRVKNELVILLKPTLVDHPQAWSDDIEGSRERIHKLKR